MGVLFGHAVAGDVPLRRLRTGAAPRGTLRIERGAVEHHGDPVVAIEGFTIHRGGALTIACAYTGDYALDPATLTITVAPRDIDPDWLTHRIACVAVPLLLAERGDLALHASAVAVPGGAVAFLGVSGSGKSTTAWALGEAGFPVLAEDGSVVTGTELWPGLAGVRLLGDGGKRPHHTGGEQPSAPVPLHALVLLGPRGGSEPRLMPIAAEDAVLQAMPHTVHAQGTSQSAAFRGVAHLARTVPVFAGTLPDDLAGAPDHAAALVEKILHAIA